MKKAQPTLLLSIAVACLFAASEAVAVDPGSQLIGCDQADNLVTVSVTSHLDPSVVAFEAAAESGQCGRLTFTEPQTSCTAGNTVRCK